MLKDKIDRIIIFEFNQTAHKFYLWGISDRNGKTFYFLNYFVTIKMQLKTRNLKGFSKDYQEFLPSIGDANPMTRTGVGFIKNYKMLQTLDFNPA